MVLETSEQHLISLTDELKLAEHYLLLEKNRFEKDFEFNIIGSENHEIDDVFLPPLLLQPFLENAIWHGLLVSPKDEKILSIKIINDDLFTKVIIDDNGAGRKDKETENTIKTHKSMEIGRASCRERV